MSLEPGQIIDNKYRIVRLIGEGGMGSVHEGENTLIKRRVAIKVLHTQAAGQESALTRFEREAQAAGRIGSDHILEVLDLGVLPDGDRYMVMEYLDGEPLSQRIQRLSRMSPEQLQPLLRQALVGLQAAHQAGIIHRDLKPDNVFILHSKAGHTDFVKIIDFGISKFNALSGDMAMTRTGAVMGTPYYMSPEQAKGSPQIDARSDLYSMGVIAYEALTGHVPFDGDTFNELMFKIALSNPPRLDQTVSDLDPAFGAIVEKMMAREPPSRYQSAEELITDLEAWAQGKPLIQGAAPAAGDRVSVAEPSAGVVSGGATAAGTDSSWATSQAGGIPKKSSAPMVAAMAAGVVLVAGGGLAAFALSGGEAESPAAPGSEAAIAAPTSEAAPAASPEPKIEIAPPPPEPSSSQDEREQEEQEAKPEQKPEKRAAPAPKPRPKPKPQVAARPKPKAAARPAKKPPSKPSSPKPKTREFGY